MNTNRNNFEESSVSFQNYPGLVLFRELDLPKCVGQSRISERTSHGLGFLKIPRGLFTFHEIDVCDHVRRQMCRERKSSVNEVLVVVAIITVKDLRYTKHLRITYRAVLEK